MTTFQEVDVAALSKPKGPAVDVDTDWMTFGLDELRDRRAAKAKQVTKIQREIERLKLSPALDAVGSTVADRIYQLNDAREALGDQLCAIKVAIKRKREGLVTVDNGRPISDLTNDQAIAYADQADEAVRIAKVALAQAFNVRAIALGELGRRKLSWRAKH